MIVVPVKEGENIEKALKKFKRKFDSSTLFFICEGYSICSDEGGVTISAKDEKSFFEFTGFITTDIFK